MTSQVPRFEPKSLSRDVALVARLPRALTPDALARIDEALRLGASGLQVSGGYVPGDVPSKLGWSYGGPPFSQRPQMHPRAHLTLDVEAEGAQGPTAVLSALSGYWQPSETREVEFLLSRFRAFVGAVEPTFASAGLDRAELLRNGGPGAGRVTPLLVLGPSLARSVDLPALSAVHAHRVERLPWGGLWIQAFANPFRASVASLAPQLGSLSRVLENVLG